MEKICKVTQEHINKGNPGIADSCAIAFALKDAEGTDTKITYSVQGSTITVWTEEDDLDSGFDAKKLYDIKVHPDDKNEVEWFVEEFDRRDENDNYIGDAEPFEFKYSIE